MPIKRQLFFINRGLDLRDIFVYSLIKILPCPITVNDIINSSPVIKIKSRQMRVILKKLVLANLVATYFNRFGLFFIFPYISLATFRHKKPYVPCKFSQGKVHFSCKFSQNKPLYKYKYINIKTSNIKKHNVVDNKHNIFAINNNLQTKKLKNIKNIFKANFPNKNNYINSEIPNNFNISLLIKKIKESPFLMDREFATLDWCIRHYNPIINDCYKEYKQKPAPPSPPKRDFTQREYTAEQCDSLLDSLDDIEI